MIKNLILTAITLLGITVLSIVADRLLGATFHGFQPPGSMELIFPPGSEKSFETTEFKYDVHINRLGLRDGEVPPKSKRFRIVAIGDSFTYGWGVNIEQSWPKQLEHLLQQDGRNVEVINLGKPGAGPPFYADLAERAIPVLQPDLVLLAPLQDDIGEAMPDGVAPAVLSKRGLLDRVRWLYPNLVRFVRMRQAIPVTTDVGAAERISVTENRRINADAAKRLYAQMTPEQRTKFDALEDKVKAMFHAGDLNPYMLDLSIVKSSDYYAMLLKADDPYIVQCTESMSAQFTRIAQAAQLYGAGLAVVPVPLGPYVNDIANRNARRVGFVTEESMIEKGKPDETFRRAAERSGAVFLSVTDAFKARKNDAALYYEFDGHFTPAGHRLFAQQLAPLLEEKEVR